jgi:hypothetical protein
VAGVPGVSLILPGGLYTVSKQGTTLDSHRMRVMGDPEVVLVGVPGRARTNATGIDLALDDTAWPTVDVEHNDVEVLVTGPAPDGRVRTWKVNSAKLNRGLDGDLDDLSYVQAFCEPTDV